MTIRSTIQNFELQNFGSPGVGITKPAYNSSISVVNELQGAPKIFFSKKYKTAIVCFNESPLERRFRRLKNKLKANLDSFYSFTTLTINNINIEKFDSNKEIHRFMNRVQIYAKRHYSEKLVYAWRVEFGKKKNRIHYHILLSRFFPIEEMYKIWNNGHIDVKKMDSHKKILNYITKYFSKNKKANPLGWKQSNRLFGTSTKMKKYVSAWEFDKNENLRKVGICAVVPNKWDYEKAFERCSKIVENLNREPTDRLLMGNK